MATSKTQSATSEDLSTLDEWGKIYSLFTSGKGKTVTRTTQSNVSADAAKAYAEEILTGNQGLASISAGQKGTGLYKSSTNQMLTNKLVSDIASKTAAATAGQTVTEVTGGDTGSRNTALAFMGAKAVGAPILSYAKDYMKEQAKKKAAETVYGEVIDTGTASETLGQTVFDVIGGQSSSGSPGMSLFNLSNAVDSGVTDTAASEGGSWLSDFGDWLFGNSDAAWADGGRVSGLRSTNVGALPDITTLGTYSRAGTGGNSAGTPSAGEGTAGDYTGTPGAMAPVTSEELAARAGPTGWDGMATYGIGKATGLEYGTVAKGLDFLEGKAISVALGGLPGPAAMLGIQGPLASLMDTGARKGASEFLDGLFDDPLTNALQAANVGRAAIGMDAIDTGTLAGKGRAAYAEAELAAQEANPGRSPESNYQGMPPATYSPDYSPSADYSGPTTTPDSDTSGWEGFSSEEAAYAEGGRVAGDSVAGVDDVKVKLGPKAGGGVGMLDGGEMVLKTASVAKLDEALGSSFLEELNKNPDKLIKCLLAGKRG